MDIIKNDDINNSLKNSTRVYLCGNLQFPNELKHVPTTGYELGISEYDFFTFEKPHIHSFNDEYNYVLEGEVKVLLINEGKEFHLKKGDLFVIHPNEPYVGKSLAGTKILFSKVPG